MSQLPRWARYTIIGVAIFFAVGAVGAALGIGEDENPASEQQEATAPAYEIVEDDTSGAGKGSLVVEVEALPDRAELDALVEELRDEYDEEGGYSVFIDCATGGNEAAANRLATAQWAVGDLGAAQTGLEDGGSELDVNDDRSCPVDP